MENPRPPVVPPDASKVSPDASVIETPFELGRFSPYQVEKFEHSTAVRLFWGRIFGWLLLVVCIGWVSLASGAYFFVKYRRGFSEVRYEHMLLLPWRLDDYRRAKGEFLIKEGMAMLELQEWRKAFDLLRVGLGAVPEHRQARLTVARIYLMAGRADVTRTTLLEGLSFHGDQIDYLREALGYFFGLQADETVVTIAAELRGRLSAGTPALRMATTALAYAHFNRGRYVEAEQVLTEGKLLGTPEARFVMARIAWERGRQEESLDRLRELTAQVADDHEIYRTFIYYLGEKGRWGEVRRAAWLRELALPDKPEAYVDRIMACGKEGDEVARAAAEDAFFEKFAGNAAALLRLGEQAAREGRVESVQRVLARCRDLNESVIDAELLQLAAWLERKDYQAVLDFHIERGMELLAWPERSQLIAGGMRAVAFYHRGQQVEAEPLVRRVWESRALPPTVLLALAEQLERVGHGVEAQRVLRQAVEVDPLNQPALVQLLRSVNAEDAVGEALPLVERLLDMRNPPMDLLESIDDGLESDRYLFTPGRFEVRAKIHGFLEKKRGLRDNG